MFQQNGFPAARLADYYDRLAFVDLELDGIKYFLAVEALAKTLHIKEKLAHR